MRILSKNKKKSIGTAPFITGNYLTYSLNY